MAEKPTHDELIGSIKAPGWTLDGDGHASGTLEDVLKAAHERHVAGGPPGLVARVENAVELDMLQIEMLWRYLGLPV